MTKINQYFDSDEFTCKCGCGLVFIANELIEVLTDVRQKYGPVIIISGYRCPEYNKEIGGAPKSFHTKGLAADIVVPGASARIIAAYLDSKYPTKYGINAYTGGWTHIDVRPTRARNWSK